jgi:hypothetical protein
LTHGLTDERCSLWPPRAPQKCLELARPWIPALRRTDEAAAQWLDPLGLLRHAGATPMAVELDSKAQRAAPGRQGLLARHGVQACGSGENG